MSEFGWLITSGGCKESCINVKLGYGKLSDRYIYYENLTESSDKMAGL